MDYVAYYILVAHYVRLQFWRWYLEKEDITWPGSVEKAKEEIKTLHDKWVEKLINMSDVEYQSQQYAKWPLEGRSFTDTALWLNGELMKNVAEIGYGRFLYAACKK